MDHLDRVAEPGRALLERVDTALLNGGAPAGHRVWPLLRRIGALPGDAFDFTVRLEPTALASSAAELKSRAADYVAGRTELSEPFVAGAWQGAGADAFGTVWRALGEHIGDGATADEPSLSGRLLATASYVDSLARWMSDLRVEVALAVAGALASAEAVTLRTITLRTAGPLTVRGMFDRIEPPAATEPLHALAEAAATVAARVLDPVLDGLRVAHDLHDEWAPWLAEVRYRPPASGEAGTPGLTTRVGL